MATKLAAFDQFIEDIEPLFHRRKVTYVDIGTYKGEYFERLIKSSLSLKEAHLVEPNPLFFVALKETLESLRTNFEERFENSSVDLHDIAIGAQNSGTCSTLDELARSFTDRHVSILKLDVDGLEQQVFSGASDLLKDQRVDVIHIEAGANSFESRQCDYRIIDDVMVKNDYRLFGVYENNQEWTDDASFLRGVDLTYVSRHFAESQPDRPNQELAEAQEPQKLLRVLLLLGQQRVEELNKEVETLSKELEVSRSSLVKRERHVSDLTQEVAQLRSEPEQLSALLDEMISSSSWRITAPMRAAATWIGRNLNRTPHEMTAEKLGRGVLGVRRRLNSLGFKQRALEELKLLSRSYNLQQRHVAVWELILWYANQGTKESAEGCLRLLLEVTKENSNPERYRQAAVIEAECHVTLGNTKDAKRAISSALDMEQHADLYLAAANLESSASARIIWVNRALSLHGLSTISLDDHANRPLYDRIMSKQTGLRTPETRFDRNSPKVTVIMPAYNAENFISTALSSVIAQTWQNLEILVVDDCSTDLTRDIVERFMADDARVKLLKAEVNGGPYIARNIALRVATGDYVTCNDADDWSHPEKIARQVKHLIENPGLIGNGSQQTRATNDLIFHRRSNASYYVFNNMSSFMFRRDIVLEHFGYWDSVRFAGDSELIRRIRKVFGIEAIEELSTGPLSFQRQTRGSLTGSETFGFHGYFMGARLIYREAHDYYHSVAKGLYYDFPQNTRPFVIPEPMRPKREAIGTQRRHFDVVIASDFRMVGGSVKSSIEEIKAQKQMGLRTGIVQMARYTLNPNRTIRPEILELLEDDHVEILVYGEKISCDLLIVRYPPVLQDWQVYVPDIEAGDVRVIVNEPPIRDYGDNALPQDVALKYEITQCQENLVKYFHKPAVWHPIGPVIREALQKNHASWFTAVSIGDQDWLNIIDVDEWRRAARPPSGPKPRIGKHGRGDAHTKWPATAKDLLNVYPDSPEYEVHILGGAAIPEKLLGYVPENWKVIDFGNMHPKDFLEKLDVFVYYPHPDWVEAFGRVILEAMAVGVPVILPHKYEILFGESALYAEPHEVTALVDKLMKNVVFYDSRVAIALDYVKSHFSYSCHAARIGKITNKLLQVGSNDETSFDDGTELPDRTHTARLFDGLKTFHADTLDLEVQTYRARSDASLTALIDQLLAHADAALERKPYSVIDKTTLPPSGNRNDYWHLAPYWWPNPDTPDGLPFVRRDGERIKGTRLYEPESERYDRTRTQRVFDDSIILMLAWKFSERADYAEHAANIIRRFFINRETAVTPHLKYSQVKMGHNDNTGNSFGIIEFKDIYFFLDAVRLLDGGGFLSEGEVKVFKSWLGHYLKWLRTSPQGVTERRARNNHGTCYDLQVASIAAYLGDLSLVQSTLQASRQRMLDQFSPDGRQPHELDRTLTAHYCCFSLQCWVNLGTLARECGEDLWDFTGSDGRGLRVVFEWLLPYFMTNAEWPFPQDEPCDRDRILPLYFAYRDHYGTEGALAEIDNRYNVKPIFFPHDGIKPFWMLGAGFLLGDDEH